LGSSSVNQRGRGSGFRRRRLLAGGGFRGSARLQLTGLGLSWPSGLGFGRDQARELGLGTANPSGHLWWWIRARLGHYDGEGGSGRWTTPACARSGCYDQPKATTNQKLRQLAHKPRGVDVMLTRGLRWPELPCRVHVNDGRAEEVWRRSRTGCSRGARGPLVARIGLGSPCRRRGN
jgi:hypothetical protein